METGELRKKAYSAGMKTREKGKPEEIPHNQPVPVTGVLVGLSLSLFIAALDATIVSTAMPKIATGFMNFEHYTWPFTSYLLTCTLATLLCGGLSATFGHKRVFSCGIGMFLVASICCALSPSLEFFTLFRGIQGIGGGLIEAGVFIAVAELFEPRVRGKYMGLITSMYGLSSVLGPLAGGVIADTIGWHWIFLMNIPICAIALVLVIRFLPGKHAHTTQALDLRGTVCAIGAVVPLTLAFSLTGTAFSWWSLPFFALLAGAACMIALLLVVERKRKHAIIPLSAFRSKQVNGAFVLGFCSQFILLGAVLFLPRFIQEGLGLSSTESALATIPLTLALVVGSAFSGTVFGKTGRIRTISCSGCLVLGAGAFLLCLISSTTSLLQIAISSAILGIGIGTSMPLSNIAAQTGVEGRDVGKVTSLALFSRGLGGTVGSAACGAVAGSVFTASALPVFGLCIAAAVICFIASFTLPRLIEHRMAPTQQK